ncbi:MAG: response regulator, partial [Desulfurivibrionaceae bacterium]|nr:response regulator [Desulfurivibrionaceae bacterium]
MALRPKVLVIEDTPVVSDILVSIVRRESYDPVIVYDGQEAKDYIESGTVPDAVFLDLLLPYVDGFELLNQMRKTEGWQNVPIIVVSAKSQEKDVIRALDMGAIDYVTKPFRTGELAARLR